MNCLLCNADELILKEKIKVSDLLSIYSSLTTNYNLIKEFQGASIIEFWICPLCDFRFYSPQLSASGAFYEYLQKYDWYYRQDKPEFKFARKYIKSHYNVLEVGAGAGYFTNDLTCKSYIGLEYNDASIELAKKKGINIIKESIESFSYLKNQSFDVVCAFQVLEHIANPKSFIESCIRVTKPGGFLIFSIPSADSYASLFPNHTLNLPPHHVSLWTDKCLIKLAETFDLKLNDIFHEICDKEQFKWLLYAIYVTRINKLMNRENRLVEGGLFNKIKNKILHKIAEFFTPYDISYFTARGQSVTVVYERK
jgi:SAM-dependent methyltransferase